jgi:CPA2 family monovalent cation:H+ antiporter-2
MRCEHCDTIDAALAATEMVCEECAATGDSWVQLRVCKTCGHVGCCDSSKNRHARAHYHQSGHAIIGPAESAEASSDWLWCYEHDSYVESDGTMR